MEGLEVVSMGSLSFYKNKKVFITGHTGFKGGWLALWLSKLGAQVKGYALKPESEQSFFDSVKLDQYIDSTIGDLRDYEFLQQDIYQFKPDICFHLAAQPLVRESYKDPIANYQTNVIGTVNVLEALRGVDSLKSVVNITTDKCYENKEWFYPYRENDMLGGYDPYSASKACSEIVTKSYYQAFFSNKKVAVATARAGNVIGGGDFSIDRIVPDIISSIYLNKELVLRNPKAVRPWQHVLDVLYGYLLLGIKVHDKTFFGFDSFNFSSSKDSTIEVEDVVTKFINVLGKGKYKTDSFGQPHEANVLELDSSKAQKILRWSSQYDVDSMIKETVEWYDMFYKKEDMAAFSLKQVDNYFKNIKG